jgi:hypothetical protein
MTAPPGEGGNQKLLVIQPSRVRWHGHLQWAKVRLFFYTKKAGNFPGAKHGITEGGDNEGTGSSPHLQGSLERPVHGYRSVEARRRHVISLPPTGHQTVTILQD